MRNVAATPMESESTDEDCINGSGGTTSSMVQPGTSHTVDVNSDSWTEVTRRHRPARISAGQSGDGQKRKNNVHK